MGTCFVEFDRFDRMETCLKKYHHSLFHDSKKKGEGRKINVELRSVLSVTLPLSWATKYSKTCWPNHLAVLAAAVITKPAKQKSQLRTKSCMMSVRVITRSALS